MADPQEDAPWLSLSEASQRTGRHVNALRSVLRRGRLEARKGSHGQWLVRLPADLPADPGPADSMAGDWTVAELNAEVAELREELAGLRAGLKAAGDVAEAQLAAKEELIQELQKMLGSLRAELAEVRKPWWRWWIGS
jgi:ribosomal protein L29